jgi:hypothetical protein
VSVVCALRQSPLSSSLQQLGFAALVAAVLLPKARNM